MAGNDRVNTPCSVLALPIECVYQDTHVVLYYVDSTIQLFLIQTLIFLWD